MPTFATVMCCHWWHHWIRWMVKYSLLHRVTTGLLGCFCNCVSAAESKSLPKPIKIPPILKHSTTLLWSKFASTAITATADHARRHWGYCSCGRRTGIKSRPATNLSFNEPNSTVRCVGVIFHRDLGLKIRCWTNDWSNPQCLTRMLKIVAWKMLSSRDLQTKICSRWPRGKIHRMTDRTHLW